MRLLKTFVLGSTYGSWEQELYDGVLAEALQLNRMLEQVRGFQ